jgi:hypothetical protein
MLTRNGMNERRAGACWSATRHRAPVGILAGVGCFEDDPALLPPGFIDSSLLSLKPLAGYRAGYDEQFMWRDSWDM